MSELELKPCPFCGGAASWCQDDNHDCHIILCDGCDLSIDVTDDPEVETVRELQVIIAARWNRRS